MEPTVQIEMNYNCVSLDLDGFLQLRIMVMHSVWEQMAPVRKSILSPNPASFCLPFSWYEHRYLKKFHKEIYVAFDRVPRGILWGVL